MAGKEELKEDGPGGKTMNLNWMQLITLSQIVFSGDTFGFAFRSGISPQRGNLRKGQSINGNKYFFSSLPALIGWKHHKMQITAHEGQ